MKNKIIKLRNNDYELMRNDEDCFDLMVVDERIRETDYFDNYDYIVGDYAYDKVRLKGFYDGKNKKKTEINDFSKLDDYINNYCQLGSRIFILKKIK